MQRLNLITHVADFVKMKGVPLELLEPMPTGRRMRALSSLNVDEVSTMLQSLELPGVVEKFSASGVRVDGSILSEIREEDLKGELKVDSRLQVRGRERRMGGFGSR